MRGLVSHVQEPGFYPKGSRRTKECGVGEDTVGLKVLAWASVVGWMSMGEDWRHLLGWSPFSFISVVLAAMASPGHWHYWLPLSR